MHVLVFELVLLVLVDVLVLVEVRRLQRSRQGILRQPSGNGCGRGRRDHGDLHLMLLPTGRLLHRLLHVHPAGAEQG